MCIIGRSGEYCRMMPRLREAAQSGAGDGAGRRIPDTESGIFPIGCRRGGVRLMLRSRTQSIVPARTESRPERSGVTCSATISGLETLRMAKKCLRRVSAFVGSECDSGAALRHVDGESV